MLLQWKYLFCWWSVINSSVGWLTAVWSDFSHQLIHAKSPSHRHIEGKRQKVQKQSETVFTRWSVSFRLVSPLSRHGQTSPLPMAHWTGGAIGAGTLCAIGPISTFGHMNPLPITHFNPGAAPLARSQPRRLCPNEKVSKMVLTSRASWSPFPATSMRKTWTLTCPIRLSLQWRVIEFDCEKCVWWTNMHTFRETTLQKTERREKSVLSHHGDVAVFLGEATQINPRMVVSLWQIRCVYNNVLFSTYI